MNLEPVSLPTGSSYTCPTSLHEVEPMRDNFIENGAYLRFLPRPDLVRVEAQCSSLFRHLREPFLLLFSSERAIIESLSAPVKIDCKRCSRSIRKEIGVASIIVVTITIVEHCH